LEGEDPSPTTVASSLLEKLQSHYGGLSNVQEHEALQYLSVMKALKAAKAEVGFIENLFVGWCGMCVLCVEGEGCGW